MAAFLKIVSGVYLVFVWGLFFLAASLFPAGLLAPFEPAEAGLVTAGLFLVAVFFSIPAVILYAFGQLVGYARAMTGHLAAMRRYDEPRINV